MPRPGAARTASPLVRRCLADPAHLEGVRVAAALEQLDLCPASIDDVPVVHRRHLLATRAMSAALRMQSELLRAHEMCSRMQPS